MKKLITLCLLLSSCTSNIKTVEKNTINLFEALDIKVHKIHCVVVGINRGYCTVVTKEKQVYIVECVDEACNVEHGPGQ